MDEFDYTTDVELRYRDLDTMGHVNNAIYVTFLEQARMRYFQDIIGVPTKHISGVIAHLEIDYLRPITADDEVSVAMRVADIGTTSLTMEQEVRADDEPAATAEVVQVVFDEDGEQPRPIPDEWRDRIGTHEGF